MNQHSSQKAFLGEGESFEQRGIHIDQSATDEMKAFTVDVTDGPAVRFIGKRIASARSYPEKARGCDYSGQVGRHSELTLYKTKAGKFVCQRDDVTCWEGERHISDVSICETVEEVQKYFGYGWLAKALHRDAEIDVVLDVN